METTENETLNAKLRNMVQPIVTLLDVLDEVKGQNLSNEQKIRMLDLMPTLIEDAKNSVKRLIE
jgi:hypothetical protein